MVLSVPGWKEILGETAARPISEDVMSSQPVRCIVAEAVEGLPQPKLFVHT